MCAACEVADTHAARLRGLLGRRTFPDGSGLLLLPCRGIHTLFLRFPIDAVFVDSNLRVVDVARVRPWHVAMRRHSHAVLELPAGTASRCHLHSGSWLAWGSQSGIAA